LCFIKLYNFEFSLFYFDSRKMQVQTISSNKQFTSIYGTQSKINLEQLLKKFFVKGKFNIEESLKDIREKAKNMTDDEIYVHIASKLKQHYDASLGERSSAKTSDILALLPSKSKIEKFLDFGSKDGSNTVAIKNALGLTKENSIGYDIFEDKALNRYIDEFTFHLYNPEKGEVINETDVDLVTSLAVLHHVEPKFIDSLMKSIHKSMRKGGFFIIREHDVARGKENLIPVIDVEHVLYVTLNDEQTLDEFKKQNPNHSGYFKSKENWDKYIEGFGFAKVKNFTVEKRLDEVNKFATYMYYAIYVKE
jgi:hypothetical protein